MRKALHVHMLIQLLGMSHPRDIFGDDTLPDCFRRLWYFVASICFRSTEAYARYLHEPEAMATLARQTLLPMTPKQRGMVGEARVHETIQAQQRARQVRDPSAAANAIRDSFWRPFPFFRQRIDTSAKRTSCRIPAFQSSLCGTRLGDKRDCPSSSCLRTLPARWRWTMR